jgi:hypothetical protein
LKLHENKKANRRITNDDGRMTKDGIATLSHFYKIDRMPYFDIRNSLFDIRYSLFKVSFPIRLGARGQRPCSCETTKNSFYLGAD